MAHQSLTWPLPTGYTFPESDASGNKRMKIPPSTPGEYHLASDEGDDDDDDDDDYGEGDDYDEGDDDDDDGDDDDDDDDEGDDDDDDDDEGGDGGDGGDGGGEGLVEGRVDNATRLLMQASRLAAFRSPMLQQFVTTKVDAWLKTIANEVSGDEPVVNEAAVPEMALPDNATLGAPPTQTPPPPPALPNGDTLVPLTKSSFENSLCKIRKQLQQANEENSRAGRANAILARALSKAHIPVPQEAIYCAGTYDQHTPGLTAGVGSGTPIVPVLANAVEIPTGGCRFGMRMLNLPDTTTISEPKRFPEPSAGGARWPHLIDRYHHTNEFAPHTEKRAQQCVSFGLYDLMDSKRNVTEQELATDGRPVLATHPINFKLRLVYADDTAEDVTINSLKKAKRHHLTEVSEPNLLNSQVQPLNLGKVTFKINHLNVLSSQTNPANRKFVYLLECTDSVHKDNLSTLSPAFYNVSKSIIKQLEPRKRAKTAAA
jgi:hypothetical protein